MTRTIVSVAAAAAAMTTRVAKRARRRRVRLGAVSFLHRFGSSLNAHFHYHVIVLDGMFSETQDGAVRFDEACDLEPHHWQELQRATSGLAS